MQKGHEGQWTQHQKSPRKTMVAVSNKLLEYTVELFKYNKESTEVLATIKA